MAYFAELDTEMTSRGFGTEAAHSILGRSTISGIAPLGPAIDACERALARRSRRIVSPYWVSMVLWCRPLAQFLVEFTLRDGVAAWFEIARTEPTGFTTEQPARPRRMKKLA